MNAREGFSPEWTDAMSVGDYSLDGQHKGLLHICRRIEQLKSDASPDGLQLRHEQLNEMQRYATVHFEAEERLLERIDYPDIVAHRQEHLKYAEDLAELLYQSVISPPNAVKMAQLLSYWWMNHILVADQHYVPYLSSAKFAIRRDHQTSGMVSDRDNRRCLIAE